MMYQQMEQPYIGMAGGGLPSLSAPMAQHVQSQGRGEDTMLVHMTPNEVNSLQGLAMAHGGSLTINPETGLPEAGFLKKLLPTLLGIGLNFIPGVGPLMAAGLVAAGSVAKTGSLKKGLMAGLQAYGGASLAGGLFANATGTTAEIAKRAAEAAAKQAGTGLTTAGATTIPTATAGLGGVGGAMNVAGGTLTNAAAPTAMTLGNAGANAMTLAGSGSGLAGAVAPATLTATKTGLSGAMQAFGNAAKAGLPSGTPGFIVNAAPKLAGMGLMSGVSGAMTPSGGGVAAPDGRIDNSYQGPYYSQDRKQIMDPDGANSSRQRRFFEVDMPETYNTMGQVAQPGSHTARGTQIMQPMFNPKAKKGQPMYDFRPVAYQGGVDPEEEENAGYAHGGEIQLADGAFVLDARTVSEIGNGSSSAGIEALRRLGGRPVKGKGDGVSDSVRARIGKRQPARVARDEVIIPAKAVRRIGNGNPQRGAAKLYALMDKAHKARKKAGRGHDTKLRHGLG